MMDLTNLSLKPNSKVLILWKDLPDKDERLKEFVQIVKSKLQQNEDDQKVFLENSERFLNGGHSNNSFDYVFSGVIEPFSINHDLDFLESLIKLIKPGGELILTQSVSEPIKFTQTLKLAGLLVPQSECFAEIEIDNEILQHVKNVHKTDDLLKFFTFKSTTPNYKIGSSKLLSFAKKSVEKVQTKEDNPSKNDVWNLEEDLDDPDVDLMDSDQLLDEEDLIKPDPKSLRVCGTTGKRKACKDCSCGLAEELEAGKAPTKKDVTSSCGSCYLGDAFRCGSCPYLGMPAFKPGEKISLSDRQLKKDA